MQQSHTGPDSQDLSAISPVRLTLMGYSALEKGKPQEAALYFEGALDNNPAFAQAAYEMGRLHETGNGVEQDYDKAFIYYMLAAEADEPDAQERLAYLFRKGLGTFRSSEQAKFWEARANRSRKRH